MIRLMWRLVRALATLVALGVALYLGGPYLLAHAGRYLITEDPLVKGDMAVVVSGQPYLCVPDAARLYHERLIPKILLVNEPRPAGLGSKVDLVMHPVSADLSDPGRWWKNRDDFRQALWEYTALVDLWRREFLGAVVGDVTLVPPDVAVR